MKREKKKTFLDILNDGYVYPETVDELTQATITEWFQFRRVTDNERFSTYFNRVLNRDYHRYRQLMRIEAGTQGDTGLYTNFDWLVTEYLERQETRDYKANDKRDETGSLTGTAGGSNNTVYGGTTETKTQGEGNTIHGLSVTNTSTSNDRSQSTSDSKSANETETRAGALTRNQPNAQSYTQDELNINDSRRGYINKTSDGYHVGEKDYSTDQEGEDFIVGLHRNFPELNIKNPTTTSDAHTSVGVISRDDTASNDETNSTSTGTTTNSGTDKTTDDHTTTTTHGQTVNVTNTGTKRDDTQGHSEGETTSNGKTRTQHTGRNGEIADILERAKSYIQTTSAWEWFRGELETCFMACID